MADPARALATLERDAALSRIGRVRRWTVAAAAAATAGLTALAPALVPGRSLRAKVARSATASSHSNAVTRSAEAPVLPPPASAAELGLRGPRQAPRSAPPAQTPAPVQPAPTQVQPAPAPTGGGGAAVSGGS